MKPWQVLAALVLLLIVSLVNVAVVAELRSELSKIRTDQRRLVRLVNKLQGHE